MPFAMGRLPVPAAALGTAAQLVGSLIAVWFVWWLARALRLGGDVRIRDHAHAAALAGEQLCGFRPVEVVLDRARVGALLRDGAGRVMVLRRHGVHFAGRLLPGHAGVRLDRNLLEIATGDAHFGTVLLDLGPEAQRWAASLRRLNA